MTQFKVDALVMVLCTSILTGHKVILKSVPISGPPLFFAGAPPLPPPGPPRVTLNSGFFEVYYGRSTKYESVPKLHLNTNRSCSHPILYSEGGAKTVGPLEMLNLDEISFEMQRLFFRKYFTIL